MERSSPGRRRTGGILGRLFGRVREHPDAPRPPQPTVRQASSEGIVTAQPAVARSAAEATLILEQALAHVEAMPQELADLKATLRGVLERLDEALQHLTDEAGRLSKEAANLAVVSERLEQHLADLTEGLGGPSADDSTAPTPGEPQFAPDNGAVAVVLAAVPGFQGLMDAQRALSGLPAADGASVVAFRNGEASIELFLKAPVSAGEIVHNVRESTRHELLIEEARPEAGRLRLRFVNGEGRG